jgi:hypothetical protein
VVGGGFGRTVHAGAPLHDVQVQLQDAPFGQDELGGVRERHLQRLADKGAVRRQEEVLDELLGNRGGAAEILSILVLLKRLLHHRPVDAAVLEKAAVLGCHDGLRQGVGDVSQWNRVVPLRERGVGPEPFDLPLELNAGHGRKDGTVHTEGEPANP